MNDERLDLHLGTFRRVVRSLLTSVEIALLSRNPEGKLLMHVGVEAMFGFSIDQFRADPYFLHRRIVFDETSLSVVNRETPWWSKDLREPFYHEVQYRHASGEVRWMHYHVLPVFDLDHQLIRHDAIFFDITKEKNESKLLSQSQIRFQTLVEGLPDGVMLARDGYITYINPKAVALWQGNSADEFLGRKVDHLFLQQNVLPQDSSVVVHTENSQFSWCLRKDKSQFLGEIITCAIEEEQGKATMFIVRDCTEEVELKRRLHKLAYEDTVTQLANRRRFFEAVGEAISQGDVNQQLAVVYLDLDGFKMINDQFGHATGDQILMQVAERLRQIYYNNPLIARLGGDEFAYLFTYQKQMGNDIDKSIDEILQLFQYPFTVRENVISLVASIGVAKYPQDAQDQDELITHADQAMYTAKLQGGNQIAFYKIRLTE